MPVEIKASSSGTLPHFRNQIKKTRQHGAAEIEERALKLREVVKTREKMLRDFEDCIEIEHGKRKFNFDKIYAVFNNELNDKNRLLSKLKDKNKVLKHQKAKLLRSVRQYMEDKEITGIKLYSRLYSFGRLNHVKIWV